MKRLLLCIVFVFASLPVFAGNGNRPVIDVGVIGGPGPDGRFAGDVTRLYEVINLLRTDPGALGLNDSYAVVELAAGATYTLVDNPADPGDGPIFLPPGTVLRGGNVVHDDQDLDGNAFPDGIPDAIDIGQDGREIFTDPLSETVLNGAELVSPPFSQGPGVIHAGLDNAVEYLTIVGYFAARGNITVDLASAAGETAARITGCILDGGSLRGIYIFNSSQDGRDIDVIAEQNVIRDHGDFRGWGIQVQQFTSAGITTSLTLRHNRIKGNVIGLFLVRAGMTASTLKVDSRSNVYEDNAGRSFSAGIVAFAARDNFFQGVFTGSIGNRLEIDSHRDAIWSNAGFGGVALENAVRGTVPAPITDNLLQARFLHTRFVKRIGDVFDGPQNRFIDFAGNASRRDVQLLTVDFFGVDPHEPLLGPTTGNDIEALFRGAESSLMPTSYDADPMPFVVVDDSAFDPHDSNNLVLTGSPTAFGRANAGWNVPDGRYFSSGRQ